MIEMTEIRQLSDADLTERIDVERESLSEAALQPHRSGVGVHNCLEDIKSVM